jgi:hypothetical protein
MGDEMGETLERDGIAVAQVFGNSLLEALKLAMMRSQVDDQMSKNTVSFSPWR